MKPTERDGEFLDDDEFAALATGKCPDCGGWAWLAGPRGDFSQNIACANELCGSRFNIYGPLGAERIGARPRRH